MASTSADDCRGVVRDRLTSGDLEHLPPFWRERVERALEDAFWEGYAFGLDDGENSFWDGAA